MQLDEDFLAKVRQETIERINRQGQIIALARADTLRIAKQLKMLSAQRYKAQNTRKRSQAQLHRLGETASIGTWCRVCREDATNQAEVDRLEGEIVEMERQLRAKGSAVSEYSRVIQDGLKQLGELVRVGSTGERLDALTRESIRLDLWLSRHNDADGEVRRQFAQVNDELRALKAPFFNGLNGEVYEEF